jgi:uncharacterized protein
MTSETTDVVDSTMRRPDKPSLRTCIVTRDELPPEELIRFVPAPDGAITPDLARKLPGRGVWVRCNAADVATAVARNAFAKSLKRKVTAAADLPAQVEALIAARAVQALALANKAGLVVTGFSKVDAEIGRGNVIVVVHAAEAAADGSGKLDRKHVAVASDQGRVAKIVKELTIAQLDLAIGRENVVHAALSAGGAATRFSIEAERLARYRLPNSLLSRAATAE